jgi:S-adenosylmethionine:tRNA ribosyltransferase-isomerase
MVNNKDLIQYISISEYDYLLPDERIAKYPLEERDQSKLLIYKDGAISETAFTQLPELLSQNELLVFNSTKVIPARLKFRKSTGAAIEIFCLEPIDPKEYQMSFQSNKCTWKCIVGNLKKWKDHELQKEIAAEVSSIILKATKIADHGTYQYIEFTWNSDQSFSEIIDMAGVTPIPPYLNRETEEIDRDRYQTVYSRTQGSVAAPTAGLHFTNYMLNRLRSQHIDINEVTLHVGAGTFKPVQTDDVRDHEMHTEYFSVPKETISQLFKHHGKIVAVGTTTLRTLESLYWLGVKINNAGSGFFEAEQDRVWHIDQWDAYRLEGNLSYPEAMKVLLNLLDKKGSRELYATTQIMIVPGYRIRSIHALITNFHQPKSTLLLLISAITGNKWKDIYRYALDRQFRFLSYGDSSILYV